MSTDITPSSGAGALFTQQGIGTTPGYAALDERRSNGGALQEGVYGTSTLVTAGGVSSVAAADFLVSQRAAGPNLSVDINMPAGGFAWVQGDTINGQGLYCVPVHSANINEVIGTADATNPRVDQVILEVLDNVLDASGSNKARTRVVPGVATTGATLANRSGAAALPGSALLLADVLVAANATTLANAVIRDRRKWARGAYVKIVRNANAAAGNDYSTTSLTLVDIDATNLKPRLECSGVPLRICLRFNGHTSANDALFQPTIDSAVVDGGANYDLHSTTDVGTVVAWDTTPSAGSHLVGVAWLVTAAATALILARSALPVVLTVEEVLRQNTANNTVTTG